MPLGNNFDKASMASGNEDEVIAVTVAALETSIDSKH